jgi:predicted ATP-grasp superfamily ATP-dependent carboligase
MQKNIIIIGGSEEQLPLVEKAKENHFITHVFDYDVNCSCSKIAHHFYPLSIYDPLPILQEAKKIQPLFIQTIATEVGNKTANYISNQLKLTSNSLETACWTTEKDEMKRVLVAHNVPTPKAYLIRNIDQINEIELPFPFMVKAADRTGGRGIQLVYNKGELEKAFTEAIEVSFNKKILVEEYFEGKQYSVEAISYRGQHQVVAITEQFYSNPPYFVESQDLIPARLNPETIKEVKEIAYKALSALNIQIGASHIELRINSTGEIKIIEVASRMGGGFRNELIKLSTGHDFVKMLLDAYSGKEPKLNPNPQSNYALLKWICSSKDLERYKKVKENYPDLIVRDNIKAINEEFKAKNGSERKGYYILRITNKDLIHSLL